MASKYPDKSIYLKGTVGPGYSSHSDDILRIKEALYLSGAYPRPDLEKRTDPSFYDAIYNFQRKNNLLADRVINPAGPTALALAAKSISFRCVICGAPHGGLYGRLCPPCFAKLS